MGLVGGNHAPNCVARGGAGRKAGLRLIDRVEIQRVGRRNRRPIHAGELVWFKRRPMGKDSAAFAGQRRADDRRILSAIMPKERAGGVQQRRCEAAGDRPKVRKRVALEGTHHSWQGPSLRVRGRRNRRLRHPRAAGTAGFTGLPTSLAARGAWVFSSRPTIPAARWCPPA
jgi:hypothetical protein